MTRTTEFATNLLMMRGVVRECPDCMTEQIFVPVDDSFDEPSDVSVSAYCCATCGAAIVVEVWAELAVAAVRGAA